MISNEYVWLAALLLLAFVGLFSILLVAWIVIGGWMFEPTGPRDATCPTCKGKR